jgi:hypothetical protein
VDRWLASPLGPVTPVSALRIAAKGYPSGGFAASNALAGSPEKLFDLDQSTLFCRFWSMAVADLDRVAETPMP